MVPHSRMLTPEGRCRGSVLRAKVNIHGTEEAEMGGWRRGNNTEIGNRS